MLVADDVHQIRSGYHGIYTAVYLIAGPRGGSVRIRSGSRIHARGHILDGRHASGGPRHFAREGDERGDLRS